MNGGLENMREVCGAIHLHTIYSDGTATRETLVRTASALHLDYVVVTDHMTLVGLENGWGGMHEGVLVIIGYEHEDLEGRHHYLVMGTNSVIGERASPQAYVDEVRRRGGIGFIAHPFECRAYFRSLPPYPWTDWGVTGFDGIEIWNQMSEWVEGLRSWTSIVKLMFPRRFLTGPPPVLLAKWDELNRSRFVAGIGGVDAHSRLLRWGVLRYRLFPLKVELQGIRTHLYVDRDLRSVPANDAERIVLQAMRDGRGFVANYRRGDARGARFWFVDTRGQGYLPGRSDGQVQLPGTLYISLPSSGDIRVIRDGTCEKVVHRTWHAELRVSSPGTYRIEVFRKGRAWIYTNPFRLG